MPLSITALYAGIFALWMTALAINVTVHRVKLKVNVGDGGNPIMLRVMRMHGNAVEYLPIALVLMAAYELNGGLHAALHAAGLVMLFARASHAYALWHTDVASLPRQVGQGLTWLIVAVLAALNLWQIA
jgi:uncharacterized membrane protein YecN with MAPEG domain